MSSHISTVMPLTEELPNKPLLNEDYKYIFTTETITQENSAFFFILQKLYLINAHLLFVTREYSPVMQQTTFQTGRHIFPLPQRL